MERRVASKAGITATTNAANPAELCIARGFAIILTISVIAGCDQIYGVRRDARLDELPRLDCVDRVIRSTPGVVILSETRTATGRELTFTGLHKPGDGSGIVRIEFYAVVE